MGNFKEAFEKVLAAEGGYVLTDTLSDRGGRTYAGISQIHHPEWGGWALIGGNEAALHESVESFYKENFWDPIHGDEIADMAIAHLIFDYAVNAGIIQCVKIAQRVVGVPDDGKIGKQTLDALNKIGPTTFGYRFFAEKVKFYTKLCDRNRDQTKFLIGWIKRCISGLPA